MLYWKLFENLFHC